MPISALGPRASTQYLPYQPPFYALYTQYISYGDCATIGNYVFATRPYLPQCFPPW